MIGTPDKIFRQRLFKPGSGLLCLGQSLKKCDQY